MDVKKIDLTAAGIIAVIVVVAFFVLFKESRAKVTILRENKTVLEEKLRSAGDMSIELDRIREEIATIQKNLDTFDRQLPEEKRIYTLLVEIDSLAKGNNISLQSIEPEKVRKGALYSRVPIRIRGTSQFKDFYRFLYQLEHMPRITRIDDLRLRRLSEGARCTIDMELAVFVSNS